MIKQQRAASMSGSKSGILRDELVTGFSSNAEAHMFELMTVN